MFTAAEPKGRLGQYAHDIYELPQVGNVPSSALQQKCQSENSDAIIKGNIHLLDFLIALLVLLSIVALNGQWPSGPAFRKVRANYSSGWSQWSRRWG